MPHQIKKQSFDLLGELGDNRARVATTLAEAHVTGTPGSAEQCAVAVFLHAILGAEPDVASVLVGSRRLLITVEGRSRPIRVTMPRPVRDFIRAFDARSYPSLVRTPAGGRREPTSRA